MKEFDFDWQTLAYAPASPARLTKNEYRISSLIKQDRGELDQIKPGLDQFGMTDDRLYSCAELALVPRLPGLGRHFRGKYYNPDSLVCEDALKPPHHVSLLGIDGIDLASTSSCEF